MYWLVVVIALLFLMQTKPVAEAVGAWIGRPWKDVAFYSEQATWVVLGILLIWWGRMSLFLPWIGWGLIVAGALLVFVGLMRLASRPKHRAGLWTK